MKISEDELKKRLTPQQYSVLVEKGTEAPFSGKYVDHKETGMYTCAACGADLFHSGTKFESNSGWPSFYDIARSGAVDLIDDTRHGMQRVEIQCTGCGGHLGHVFDDAPDMPTGRRYCVNSCALEFKPEEVKVNQDG